MKIPFIDLTKPTQEIKKEFLAAVEKLLDHGNFILTEEVVEFEKLWAQTIGTKYCVGVSNGADALFLALVACGVKSGNEVITQGNAYNASVTAILRAGGIPRFTDVLEDTLMLNPDKIESLINKKTKAILPVHLFGHPNNMEAISIIAKKYNLAIIEDCAQAHLAEYDNKRVGDWGNAGAFSFYPTKNLGAFGDAGAVTTNDQKIYEQIVATRNLGQVTKNNHEFLGYNMRLDPIQAVVLTLKLRFLKSATVERQVAASYYDKLFTDAQLPIKIQTRDPRAKTVHHLYVIQSLSMNRDELSAKLATFGIQTAVHYPIPVYHQPFYKGHIDLCPVTNKVLSRIISLPLFPGITTEQQDYVVKTLASILRV